MEEGNDLVYLLPDSSASLLEILCSLHSSDKSYVWAGEPELIAFFDRQVIKEETCNENCKLFITDPELERTPPHPYSVANVCWQNICKGGEKDYSIVIQGPADIVKRNIVADTRFFILENNFPKIKQHKFDLMDMLLTFAAATGHVATNLKLNGAIITSFSYDSTYHNLSQVEIQLKSMNWSVISATEVEEENFYLLYLIHYALKAGKLRSISEQIQLFENYQYCKEDIRSNNQFNEIHFNYFQEALKEIGINASQISEIFRILIAILYLGNISFVTQNGKTIVRPSVEVEIVCQLIGCGDLKEFCYNICSLGITVQQAVRRRDLLAQEWYKIVIEYLIGKINLDFLQTLGARQRKSYNQRKINLIQLPTPRQRISTQKNGMIQLQMNYLNEWMVHFYKNDILSNEKLDEEKSEIEEVEKNESNNVLLFLLHLNDVGIDKSFLTLLNSYSFKKNASGACTEEIKKIHGKNCEFVKVNEKEEGGEVEIRHFGIKNGKEKKIKYSIREILNSNLPLPIDWLKNINKLSSLPLLSNSKAKSKFPTFIEEFKSEIDEIIKMMVSSDHYYIHCFSSLFSGSKKKVGKGEREEEEMEEYLRIYPIEARIKFYKSGFPYQLHFSEFLERFAKLDSDSNQKGKETEEIEMVEEDNQTEEERVKEILKSVNGLNKNDFYLSNEHIYFKFNKQFQLIKKLWEINDNNFTNYNRSRSATSGELFHRNSRSSSIVIDNYSQQSNFLPNSAFVKPPFPSGALHPPSFTKAPAHSNENEYLTQQYARKNKKEEEIMFEREEEHLHWANGSPNSNEFDERELEGKGKALLVMMSVLGDYESMIPLIDALHSLFNSYIPSPSIKTNLLHHLAELIQTYSSNKINSSNFPPFSLPSSSPVFSYVYFFLPLIPFTPFFPTSLSLFMLLPSLILPPPTTSRVVVPICAPFSFYFLSLLPYSCIYLSNWEVLGANRSGVANDAGGRGSGMGTSNISPYQEMIELDKVVNSILVAQKNKEKIKVKLAKKYIESSRNRFDAEIKLSWESRNINYLIKLIKVFAILWRNSENTEDLKKTIFENEIIEYWLILVSDAHCEDQILLTIAKLLKFISSESLVQSYFANGSGIRCLLIFLSNFYENVFQSAPFAHSVPPQTSRFPASAAPRVSESRNITRSELAREFKVKNEKIRSHKLVSNARRESAELILQTLLNLSENELFVDSLKKLKRFEKGNDYLSIPSILTNGIYYHSNNDEIIVIIVRLIEKLLIIYCPSGDFIVKNTISSLIQLLDDRNLFYHICKILAMINLPEFIPTDIGIDTATLMIPAISILIKNCLINVPSSFQAQEHHYQVYAFVFSQLISNSDHCKGRVRELLGESICLTLLNGTQVTNKMTDELAKVCHSIHKSPKVLTKVMESCDLQIEEFSKKYLL